MYTRPRAFSSFFFNFRFAITWRLRSAHAHTLFDMCTCRYTLIMLLDSKTRRLALTDGAQQNPLDLPDDAHLVHRITSGSWVCTECRHPIGCHGSGNDAICIGVETPSAPPAEAAPSADAGGPYFHALEKIWCISHVLKVRPLHRAGRAAAPGQGRLLA